MNNVSTAVALVTAPSTAFAELRERPRFWFPLLLTLLITAALIFWYYSVVDIEWAKDAMLANGPKFQEMNEEQRSAAMSMLTRDAVRFNATFFGALAIGIFMLLQALYYLLAAKVTKLSPGFKHWFALTCWAALPILLSSVVAAILLLLADNPQIPDSVLQPLSLNELVLHRPANSPGYSLFAGLNIPALLSWTLAIIGVRTWSQRSWSFSALFVLLPWIVIYALWAFFAFR